MKSSSKPTAVGYALGLTASELKRPATNAREPLHTNLACALDDVQASRPPEVMLMLRPAEARVSRAVDHTLGAVLRDSERASTETVLVTRKQKRDVRGEKADTQRATAE